MYKSLAVIPISFGVIGIFLLVGCGETDSSKKNVAKNPDVARDSTAKAIPTTEGDHGHKPSSHGGVLVSIGSDSYHAEVVFEKGGNVRLFTLGKDESSVLEVETQNLTGYAKPKGSSESESFILAAKPQEGDKQGKTSLFIGKLPNGMAGKPVEVTIPSLRIGNERFRLTFHSEGGINEHDLPAKVVDEEEKKLYLTPKGKYSEADIRANGGKTASQKFEGLKADHDANPKKGDKICPISLTKANPKFSWIIDGKTYEFCCPPCVDEFLHKAKEKPDELKLPEEYIKK